MVETYGYKSVETLDNYRKPDNTAGGTDGETARPISSNAFYDHIALKTGVHGKIIVKRTTDSAAVNNSTTLVSDDQLVAAVEANKTYILEFRPNMSQANIVADFMFGWAVPSGTSMLWSVGSRATGEYGAGDTQNLTWSATTGSGNIWGLVIVGATAGNLVCKWAQAVATVADNKLLAGSALILWEI